MNYMSRAKDTATIVFQFIHESTMAKVFLIIIGFIFLLNMIKYAILRFHMKKEKDKKDCAFLKPVQDEIEQICSHPEHSLRFKYNNNSCKDCKGKRAKVSMDEIEGIVSKSNVIIEIIFIMADCGNALLPYLSFAYTLIVAAYVTPLK